MWFDIIKETEEDRLRALGYPVPEKPKSTRLTRDKIIDEFKNWANNTTEISPFEEYFVVVEPIQNIRKIPAQNKTALVVEKTTANTEYFKEEWTEIAYDINDNYSQYRRRKTGMDDPINDTYVGSFYVGLYEIGKNYPMQYFGTTDIQALLNTLNDIKSDSSVIAKIRGGGFYASIEDELQDKGIDINISNSGLLWVTGASGNRYKVDFTSGDCNVTVTEKEIKFANFPELNTKISFTICVHANRQIPLGDRYAQLVNGLTNDTSPIVPDIIKLIAMPWVIEGHYTENFIQRKLKSKIHITEGNATTLIGNSNGNVISQLPW